MDFDILEVDNKARITEIKINRHSFKSPLIFLGYSFRKNANPTPWKETLLEEGRTIKPIEIEGVLINAYDYLKQKITSRGHKALGYDGVIMMDSGGYQIQQGTTNLKREDVLAIQKQAKPEIAFPMDYPLNPTITKMEIKKRINLTLKNNFYWDDHYHSAFINIVHGFEIDLLTRQMNELNKPRFLAIGSFVPYLMYSNRRNLIDVIIEFRAKFPDTWLHVFGVSHLVATLMVYLGVDSVDSSSWLHNARFGSIHFHDSGPRAVAKRDRPPTKAGHRPLTYDEWKKADCDCPVCKEHGWEWLQKRGVAGLKARGCHNAFINEIAIKNIHSAIKEKRMKNYVKEVFEKSSLKYLSRYAFERSEH